MLISYATNIVEILYGKVASIMKILRFIFSTLFSSHFCEKDVLNCWRQFRDKLRIKLLHRFILESVHAFLK